MKKMIMICIISMSLNAQEPATEPLLEESIEEVKPETEEVLDLTPTTSDETESKEQEAEETIPQSYEVSDLKYLDFAKTYLANKSIKNVEEVLWEMSDYDYKSIKNNDFLYEKVKEEKTKEYKETLKKSLVLNPAISVKIIVGKYDFSKNQWPVTDIVNDKFGFLSKSSTSLYKNSLDYFPNGIEGLVAENNKLPATFSLKIEDLNKIKTLKMDKITAEKISNHLDSSRAVECVLMLKSPKLEEKKVKSYAPGQTTRLEATYFFSTENVRCFEDNLKTKEIALK